MNSKTARHLQQIAAKKQVPKRRVYSLFQTFNAKEKSEILHCAAKQMPITSAPSRFERGLEAIKEAK